MGREDNGGLRGETGRGGWSSLVVLAACALLLGGGWYWLEGGSGRPEPLAAAPAAPEASPVQDARPAMAGEAAGERAPVGVSSDSALFGGLGGTDVAENQAEAPPPPSPPPTMPPRSGTAPLFRQAMVGGWSSEDKSCEAATMMILGDDGTFVVGNEATGDWKLLGNRLILQARSMRKAGVDLAVFEVEPLGNGRIRAKGPDGTISVLVRCSDR